MSFPSPPPTAMFVKTIAMKAFVSYIFSSKAYPEAFHAWFITVVMAAVMYFAWRDLGWLAALLFTFFSTASISASWLRTFMLWQRSRGRSF